MKKILYIIGLTLCLVLAFEKSYGQGWERTITGQTIQLTNGFVDICPTNDGGCIYLCEDQQYRILNSIITSGITQADSTRGLFVNRFDKYGNKIWNYKPMYNFHIKILDSIVDGFGNVESYVTDFDTLLYADAKQAVQLPNNNIVYMHSGSNIPLGAGSRIDKYFTIVDNYGKRIKSVHNLNDTFEMYYDFEKMYFDKRSNTIECVRLKRITNDSILFIKYIYDSNFVKVNTIYKVIYKANSNLYYFTPQNGNGQYSTFRSDLGNFYWYDNSWDDIGFNKLRLLKLENDGDMVYDTSITLNLINSALRPTTPSNYQLVENPSNTRYPKGIDIDENNRNETAIAMSVYCWFDSLGVRDNFYQPIEYKTKHVIFTLNATGSIIGSNIIESLVDTFGSRYSYNNGGVPDQVLIKYNDDDHLLLVKTNIAGNIDIERMIYESVVLNPTSNFISSQRIYKPFGHSGYKLHWQGIPFIKKYSNDKKDIFISGLYYSPANNLQRLGVIKIDNNGYPFGNVITGNVFNDANNNCAKNTLEKGLPNYTVTATKDNYNNFGTTDRNGNYVIGLADSGNYTVAVRPSQNYPLWNPVCNPSQSITVENNIAFDTVNFAMKPSVSCVFNTVNISNVSPFRIGQASTYYVSYCNNGTIASTNTYITVKLDSLLDINSSTLTYTSLPNNTYRFNIGTLDFLNCGNFSFVATPRIGAVQLNQTLCAEAHIYPDTICTTPNYTGAFIEASARCLGDSLQFKLQNIGIGNMPTVKKYIVIEDNVLRINKNYQLNAGQLLTETIKADSGSTYRIIAEQPDDLPLSYGDKFATAAVENCQPIRTGFNTGFFTQFPNYDGEPYRAVSCNVITGAFDPNDKVASPTGYASQHYIEKNTPIDYQINFQNTGNDTAFKVVVVDTIAPTLDINSIQLGVASHRYQFQRTDSNVVQFVFDSIMLVDSFKNERLSHGFVKFKIQQKANNANGTKIYNKAAIYFDYNLPIITNQTYHTVGQNFVQVNLLSDINSTKLNVKAVKVFPNPFRDKTQIIVDSDLLKEAVLLLMTIDGKIIKTIPSTTTNSFDIYREDLSNGMYLFKIIQNQETVASGKLLVQ